MFPMIRALTNSKRNMDQTLYTALGGSSPPVYGGRTRYCFVGARRNGLEEDLINKYISIKIDFLRSGLWYSTLTK